ncbi:MAG TPA: VanZ family protein [Steroidobacteraceae bacterium]|nr:VanZ family protein [Steroidobacteraceae bacterium]HQR49799.1 VanZ family protein [Steroidobacteraceae bacterium]
MLPLRYRGWWIALSAALIAYLIYGSLVPIPPLPMPGNFDKLEHFVVYAGLAIWFTGLFPRSRYGGVVLVLLLIAGSLEIAQGLMHMGRQADVLDMAANATGVGIGLVCALVLTGNWARRVESWLGPR